MLPSLPASATERYEQLRRQAIVGGGRREAFAVLLYHGLYQGLAHLISASELPRSPPPASATAPPADSALIRQVTNMILTVQSELHHVY